MSTIYTNLAHQSSLASIRASSRCSLFKNTISLFLKWYTKLGLYLVITIIFWCGAILLPPFLAKNCKHLSFQRLCLVKINNTCNSFKYRSQICWQHPCNQRLSVQKAGHNYNIGSFFPNSANKALVTSDHGCYSICADTYAALPFKSPLFNIIGSNTKNFFSGCIVWQSFAKKFALITFSSKKHTFAKT